MSRTFRSAHRVSAVQAGTCLRLCVTAKQFRQRDVKYLQRWLSKAQGTRIFSSVLMRMGDPGWHQRGEGETLPQLGSDLAALRMREISPAERMQHYRSVADLVRQIGESSLPVHTFLLLAAPGHSPCLPPQLRTPMPSSPAPHAHAPGRCRLRWAALWLRAGSCKSRGRCKRQVPRLGHWPKGGATVS